MKKNKDENEGVIVKNKGNLKTVEISKGESLKTKSSSGSDDKSSCNNKDILEKTNKHVNTKNIDGFDEFDPEKNS